MLKWRVVDQVSLVLFLVVCGIVLLFAEDCLDFSFFIAIFLLANGICFISLTPGSSIHNSPFAV